jgi:PPOX class probable F420-dependent enzyme
LFRLAVLSPLVTPEERAFLERARVATLATVDDEGRPHAVPICYASLEPRAPADGAGSTGDVRVVSAIDEKPKTTRELRRVRNVRSNPRVTLLVDRYREDWAALAWVQVRGRARVLEPGADRSEPSVHAAAVTALESKYDQYAGHDLDDRPVLSIRVDRTVSWGALEDGDSTGGR